MSPKSCSNWFRSLGGLCSLDSPMFSHCRNSPLSLGRRCAISLMYSMLCLLSVTIGISISSKAMRYDPPIVALASAASGFSVSLPFAAALVLASGANSLLYKSVSDTGAPRHPKKCPTGGCEFSIRTCDELFCFCNSCTNFLVIFTIKSDCSAEVPAF